MREELIEKEILRILKGRGCGAKLATLKSETALRLDMPLMPVREFTDTLSRLEMRGCVRKETTALGSELYSITALGSQTLQEEGWM